MTQSLKFNPQRCEKILQNVRDGMWFEDACVDTGVSQAAVYQWAKRGMEEGSGPYFDFACALNRAKREANAPLINEVRLGTHSNGEPDWKARAWLLERKERKRFGPQVKVEVESFFDRVLSELESKLTPEEFAKVAAVVESTISSQDEGEGI